MRSITAIVLFSSVVLALLVLWLNCPDANDEVYFADSEQVIDISPQDAWLKLQDLTLAHFYVPGLIKTVITTENTTGVGASRRVYDSPDNYLNETVTAWDEGAGFTLRLHQDNGEAIFPFSSAFFTYRISDHGDGQTRLNTSLQYTMSAGCMGHWLNKLLAGAFRKRTEEVSDNLKRFYESNKGAVNE